MPDAIAPPESLYVCLACGKWSTTKYGLAGSTHSRGWDESCMLNSQLIPKVRLVMRDDRVIEVLPEEGFEIRDEA